jgi:putative transposase
VLTLVDLYSRECLALRAGFLLNRGDIAAVLEQLKSSGREPETITVDNGSEFTSKELDTWSYLNDVKLDFIRAEKPLKIATLRASMGSFEMSAST